MASDLESLFDTEAWSAALTMYAEAVHLTVQLYDSTGALACGPIYPTPLFKVLARKEAGRKFVDCAAKCLAQGDGQAQIVIDGSDGVALIGAPLQLESRVMGAAVAGYPLRKFPDRLTIERLSRDHQVSSEELWSVCRTISPLSEAQLRIQGHLLRVLGESLLREEAKSRESARLFEQARAANLAKDEFLSVLSHELRTPLHAILTSVAVALPEKENPATIGHLLALIERNARTLSRMVEDLLDVSRIVTGKLSMDAEQVELNSLLGESLDMLRPAAEAKNILLEHEVESECPVSLPGDNTRLRQVLWNLICNAVKFTPPHGRVRVTAKRAGSSGVALTVSDTGEGIDPEFLPHVFERFTQANPGPTRRHFGLGLGLAISRHLIEMHGGTIRAESPLLGKGTTFTVELPLKQQSAPGQADRES
jgi:signal transduction histidine kinase